MTTTVDIVNRALQRIGTRTTVTAAELAANPPITNEAIQANISLDHVRTNSLRMAPWNFALKTINLVYITSTPGTPENTSSATTLWQPGQPSPPWAYEYQYPVDCARPVWITPATQTGFSGVPITSAVTGGVSTFWRGPPVKFRVQNDQFLPVTAAAVASPGAGYVVGEVITLASGPNTSPPIGAPAQLMVTSVGGGGAVTGVSVVSQVPNTGSSTLGGSYFAIQPNPVPQGSSTGAGVGATFNLTQGAVISQPVILTNQEFPTLTYIQQVTDPNAMDTLFQDVWAGVLGAKMCIGLTGDKQLANMLIGLANADIERARTPDGNEGLTLNDVTPDWIRIRGITYVEPYAGPFSGFDWGGLWPVFG
jgi:hypothetical protein